MHVVNLTAHLATIAVHLSENPVADGWLDDGTYLVGTDIPTGTYKGSAGDLAYW